MGVEGRKPAEARTAASDRHDELLGAARRQVTVGPSFVLQRAGVLLQRARTSVWFHGETPAQFDAALTLIREAMRDRPHVRLVLTSAAPATVAYLRRSFPDDHASVAPWSTTGAVRRFVAKLNPRLVVLLDGGRSLGAHTLAALATRDVPLVDLALGGDVGVGSRAGVTSRVGFTSRDGVAQHVGAASDPDAAGRAGSGAHGTDADHAHRVRRVVLDDRSVAAAMHALDALRDLLPDSPPLPRARQAWRIATFRDRIGRSRLWAQASTLLSRRRIDEWDALRARLGAPRSVLVLGNGPSSEDPRLAAVAHDCLIRVNFRWRERGLLTDPDVVFVGDAATMSRIPSSIFGFWNVPLERGMLLRRLVTRGPAPIEYVTMERLSPIIRDRDWPARPTNGALAVLTAAALQPERLTIAGIDLFQHADGRYPGDALARNDYSHVHAMDTDLAIMQLALQDFHGELVVLSDVLRRELDVDGDDVDVAEAG